MKEAKLTVSLEDYIKLEEENKRLKERIVQFEHTFNALRKTLRAVHLGVQDAMTELSF